MSKQKKTIEIETESSANADEQNEQAAGKNWDKISNRDLEEQFDELDMDKPSVEAMNEGEKTAGALEQPSIIGLEDKLTKTEQENQKNYDNWLRTKAEYDNFKRRAEKDLSNAHKYAVDKLAQDLIPALDSLDQGLGIKDFEEVKNEILHQVREGMELTYKMLLDTLNKYGIEQINPEGQAFNPEHHEAMSMQEDMTVAPNTVLIVFQKGYVLHGRLLRPARVIVSKTA